LVAHAKRCTVQLGVYDRSTKTLQNLESGAMLAGGIVLTAAHMAMGLHMTENYVVLIGAYTGDAEPARWAYAAEVLTPLAVLREEHEGTLLDLALLQIASAVTCDPPHCPGKDAVLCSPAQQIEMLTEVAAVSFDGVPCLKCDPGYELHVGEAGIVALGFAAASGQGLFASGGDVVSLDGGFLQTRAFIDTGSGGGPVINAAGDVVGVVSHGGGLPHHLQGGDIVELAKARPVRYLRNEHTGGAAHGAATVEQLSMIVAAHAGRSGERIVELALEQQAALRRDDDFRALTDELEERNNGLTAALQANAKVADPNYVCPITHQVMHEPVVAADGFAYEKLAFQIWLEKNPDGARSPMTSVELEHRSVTQDRLLRTMIDEYRSNETGLLVASLEADRPHLLCPLSNMQLVDPVVAADGWTYERSAIMAHLATSNQSPKQPDVEMGHRNVTPNWALRSMASEARRAQEAIAELQQEQMATVVGHDERGAATLRLLAGIAIAEQQGAKQPAGVSSTSPPDPEFFAHKIAETGLMDSASTPPPTGSGF
jgi:hypothetical protein